MSLSLRSEFSFWCAQPRYWWICLSLTFAKSSSINSTDPPVKVGVADDVHIFIVSTVEKLLFRHITPSVIVLHVPFLPIFSKQKSGDLNQAAAVRGSDWLQVRLNTWKSNTYKWKASHSSLFWILSILTMSKPLIVLRKRVSISLNSLEELWRATRWKTQCKEKKNYFPNCYGMYIFFKTLFTNDFTTACNTHLWGSTTNLWTQHRCGTIERVMVRYVWLCSVTQQHYYPSGDVNLLLFWIPDNPEGKYVALYLLNVLYLCDLRPDT